MDKILSKIEKLQKESKILHEKANRLQDQAQDLMEKHFGLRDGEVLSSFKFVTLIKRIMKK